MKKLFLPVLSFCLLAGGLCAQDSLFLWPGEVPNMARTDVKEQFMVGDNGILRIKGVTRPSITVFLPAEEKANGTAVIICPGGGYHILASKHEGYDLARWFNEMGVAAFVLKYRLPGDKVMADNSIGPLQDAQQAIKLVRQHAKKWNINPQKVGIMGFSAGGHLASTALTHYNRAVIDSEGVSLRPDFGMLVYPVISMRDEWGHRGSRDALLGENAEKMQQTLYSSYLQVSAETPPVFLVHSTDDKAVPVQNSLAFYQQLVAHDVPAEMHIYETGGHGYGMGRQGTSSTSWPGRCREWLQLRGLLD